MFSFTTTKKQFLHLCYAYAQMEGYALFNTILQLKENDYYDAYHIDFIYHNGTTTMSPVNCDFTEDELTDMYETLLEYIDQHPDKFKALYPARYTHTFTIHKPLRPNISTTTIQNTIKEYIPDLLTATFDVIITPNTEFSVTIPCNTAYPRRIIHRIKQALLKYV